MNIRPVNKQDAAQIAEIYNYYIETSHATFELETIDAAEMENRIKESFARDYPFFVGEAGAEILGYAYGRQFRPRRAYRHSIEVSVYIKNGAHGKGIGTKLYERLFTEILQKDFHAVIAGISLPNEASIKLHEKFGFEKVAHFREVGFKFGRWIDVGYWELIKR
ncbi:MAG TPA: GNAT family N-acetyltransferase [Pyrinomonadaceae bacterium]|jgi:phosphinothricin acetyltransferase